MRSQNKLRAESMALCLSVKLNFFKLIKPKGIKPKGNSWKKKFLKKESVKID